MELAEICGGVSTVKASFGNINVEYDSAMPLVKISMNRLDLGGSIDRLRALYYTDESYYKSARLADLNVKIELHESLWDALQHYKKSLVDYIEALTRKAQALDKKSFELYEKVFELYKRYRRQEQLRTPQSKISSWLRRFRARFCNSNPVRMNKSFLDLTEEVEKMEAEREAMQYFGNAMRYGHDIFTRLYKAGYQSPEENISPQDIDRRLAMLGLFEVTERIINSLPDIKRLKDSQILLLEE